MTRVRVEDFKLAKHQLAALVDLIDALEVALSESTAQISQLRARVQLCAQILNGDFAPPESH